MERSDVDIEVRYGGDRDSRRGAFNTLNHRPIRCLRFCRGTGRVGTPASFRCHWLGLYCFGSVSSSVSEGSGSPTRTRLTCDGWHRLVTPLESVFVFAGNGISFGREAYAQLSGGAMKDDHYATTSALSTSIWSSRRSSRVNMTSLGARPVTE